jgi:hypothetical protein
MVSTRQYVSWLLAASCVLSAIRAQYWTGPYNISSSSSDDVNPSACKEFLTSDRTCLVWQRMTTENWDIFSRFGSLYDGSDWSPETRVTYDSVDDVNPAVAFLRDSSYWCVWEHKVSRLVGDIRASFVTVGDSWSQPVELGPVIHTDGDSAMPSIITISGASADTVWVAWRNHDTSGTYIRCVYHAGDSWSSPEIAVAADLRHSRLGRVEVEWVAKPMLVWEQTGDIWYSIRDSAGWTSPAEVAPSDSEDHEPDVVNSGALMSPGSYVVWQSMRDGDTAIYIAGMDSLAIGQRVSGGYGNFNPAGANIAFTTLDYWYCVVAWVSDRNGNPDVYTRLGGGGDVWVDVNSANDMSPVVTCLGNGYGAQMAWVVWQSNRNGDWDIFGSYEYNSGIEESFKPQAPSRKLAPTILSGASGGKRLASCVLFDAMGRTVMNPRSGIYFVRDEGQRTKDEPTGPMRKVVIQR